MLGLSDEYSGWHLRYVILIWLHLICMIPFDLCQFDESDEAGRTANRLESLAKSYIGKAGLERDGAALLLSRLYMRYGLSKDKLKP
jgi:tubulin-specific chaperone D